MTQASDKTPNDFLLTLSPVEVWKPFVKLLSIPRETGNEHGVRKWLETYAEANKAKGYQYQEDPAGNVLIKVPGKGKGIRSEPVAFQAHMDMVCVKVNGSNHNFLTDPIQTRIVQSTIKKKSSTVLRANGTTLGADNGIGMSLAIGAVETLELRDRPPIDLIFTVAEEVGMKGALGLNPEFLQTQRLINLDVDDENVILISSAGGCDIVCRHALEREAAPSGSKFFQVKLDNLLGGHSGIDISEPRGNAVLLAAGVAQELLAQIPGASLTTISGGEARNSIPKDAQLGFWIPAAASGQFESKVKLAAEKYANAQGIPAQDLKRMKVELTHVMQPAWAVSQLLSKKCSAEILSGLVALPNGVFAHSAVVPGLVESSSNLGKCNDLGDELEIILLARTSNDAFFESFGRKVEALLKPKNFSVKVHQPSPKWSAEKSRLLDKAVSVFTEHFGRPPLVAGVHAGLECGILKTKRSDLQIISIGPDNEGLHTVEEQLDIASVGRTFEAIKKLLTSLV